MKRILKWILIYALTYVVFICARRDAVNWRGNTSYGGEIMILILPVLAWGLVRTIKDWVRELKSLISDDEEANNG